MIAKFCLMPFSTDIHGHLRGVLPWDAVVQHNKTKTHARPVLDNPQLKNFLESVVSTKSPASAES